jgi:hypothetical protein
MRLHVHLCTNTSLRPAFIQMSPPSYWGGLSWQLCLKSQPNFTVSVSLQFTYYHPTSCTFYLMFPLLIFHNLHQCRDFTCLVQLGIC